MNLASSRSPTIAQVLWTAADEVGDRTAIVSPVGPTTYAELRQRATSMARTLETLGVRPGDRVAILLDRGSEAAAAYFGALAAGAVAVFVNERLRPRQIEHVLDRAKARVLLTSRSLLHEHQRELATNALIVDVAEIPDTDAPGWSPVASGPSDLAQIIFTSGSSGLPKGVMFTHRAVRSAIETVVAYLALSAEERIFSLLPFSSVYGVNQLLCAVFTRSTLVVGLSPLPSTIVAEARRHHVTMIAGVPPLWSQLLATPTFLSPIESLRIVQNAGGHLPVDAVRRLRSAQPHARLFLQYGMTETFRSTYLPPEEVDAHPDSMGRAVPGATIWVIGEEGRGCAVGEAGELVFSGPTIAEGYWEDETLTAETFRSAPGPTLHGGTRAVYSGDIVRRDAEDRLYYVSRRDRMIKSLGFRIGPDEIVDVLFASGDISEAAITTQPDPVRGERIIAFVVLRPEGTFQHLERYSRMELPRHMQPTRIEVRATLPRMPSGKYDIEVLRTQVDFTMPSRGDEVPAQLQ